MIVRWMLLVMTNQLPHPLALSPARLLSKPFFFLEEKGFTGQGHAETNLD
jgi:hypothetical protein